MNKRRVDVLRLKVLRDLHVKLPPSIDVKVDGVRFLVAIFIEGEVNGGIRLPELHRPVMLQPKTEQAGTDLDFPQFRLNPRGDNLGFGQAAICNGGFSFEKVRGDDAVAELGDQSMCFTIEPMKPSFFCSRVLHFVSRKESSRDALLLKAFFKPFEKPFLPQ